VTAEESFQETDPTWSQDGSVLAFGHVDLVHSDRTSIQLLDLKTQQISELPGSQGIFAPRWSPDGRSIIGINSALQDKLMLYDVKSQKWRQVQTTVNSFGYIAWSPDSASVYFDTIFNGDSGYFRLRINDSKLEKLIDLRKLRQFRSQFGPGAWTGLGPGEVPLLVRDNSTQEIYAFDWQLP
jgi:Tol biopolymer transport system component